MKFQSSDIDARLEVACRIADAARNVTLDAYHHGPIAENKSTGSDFDPVTATDLACEKRIRELLADEYAQDGIVGEEFADQISQNGWRWCVDPIDGTRAFVAGIPVWSTLIGVFFDDEPVIGVIDHPALDQRFIGAHGKAWRYSNGDKTRIKTRKCAGINEAILSCTEPMAMFDQQQLKAYETIRRTAQFSRLGLDAYSYALTASGRIDLVIEAQLKPYDIAALIPIIEGAGGKITDWQGGPAHKIGKEGGAVVCVGDPDLLEQVYPYLERALD